MLFRRYGRGEPKLLSGAVTVSTAKIPDQPQFTALSSPEKSYSVFYRFYVRRIPVDPMPSTMPWFCREKSPKVSCRVLMATYFWLISSYKKKDFGDRMIVCVCMCVCVQFSLKTGIHGNNFIYINARWLMIK